jgi:hypothetical protein
MLTSGDRGGRWTRRSSHKATAVTCRSHRRGARGARLGSYGQKTPSRDHRRNISGRPRAHVIAQTPMHLFAAFLRERQAADHRGCSADAREGLTSATRFAICSVMQHTT